jgi:hypothetical protein
VFLDLHHFLHVHNGSACDILAGHEPAAEVVLGPVPSPLHHIVLLVLLQYLLAHLSYHFIGERKVFLGCNSILFVLRERHLFFFLIILRIFILMCFGFLSFELCPLLLLFLFFLLVLDLLLSNDNSFSVIVDLDQGCAKDVPVEKIEFFLLGHREGHILWLEICVNHLAYSVHVVQTHQHLPSDLSYQRYRDTTVVILLD